MEAFYNNYIRVIWSDFVGWGMFDKVWLSLALLSILVVSDWNDPLVAIATTTNVMCVVLMAKGRMSNWYWGLIGASCMALVGYRYEQYGLVALNIVYVAIQLFGICSWGWSSHRERAPDVEVRTLNLFSLKEMALFFTFVIGVTVITLLYTILLEGLGGVFTTTLDYLVLLLSTIGIGLAVMRYTNQWVFWISSNVVCLWIWGSLAISGEGPWAMVVMWSVFMINSLYGFYKWNIVVKGK